MKCPTCDNVVLPLEAVKHATHLEYECRHCSTVFYVGAPMMGVAALILVGQVLLMASFTLAVFASLGVFAGIVVMVIDIGLYILTRQAFINRMATVGKIYYLRAH